MTSNLFESVAGVWRGDEKMWNDPKKSEPDLATAQFECAPIYGGRGFTSSYVQSVGGQETIRCFTVIRQTGEENEVEYFWSADGHAGQIYKGRVSDGVIRAEGEIAGAPHRFVEDYSVANELKTTAHAVTPDGSERKVFEAHYHRLPEVGSIGWRDLTVDDAERVRDFYAAVAGWEPEGVSMGDYSDFNMKAASGKAIAGVCHKRGENSDLPSQWLMYVTVADLEKSISEVERLGGEIVAGPRGLAGGRFAVVKDPAGAVIALWRQ